MTLLLFTAGCTPQAIQIGADTVYGGGADMRGDSGDMLDSDSGEGGDSGDSGDSAAPDTGDSGVSFDLSRWSGIRHFRYESDWWSCDQVVAEEGELAEWIGDGGDENGDDDVVEALLRAECPDCERFYLVTPETDTVCENIRIAPTWRGLRIGEDGTASLVVLVYVEGDDGVYQLGEDDHAAFHAGVLSYSYTFGFYGADVGVYGVVNFPVE